MKNAGKSNKPLQRSNKWYGCRRDLRDARDHRFAVTALKLPAAVDLRAHCAPVMDQGQLGSCVSHGVTGALRYALKSQHHRDFHMARLQNYYDSRVIEGSVNSDDGCEIRDAIKAAAKLGVGHETMWPYKIAKFTSKPTARVYADALHFLALEYQRVDVSTLAVKTALASGYPVIIGLTLYESFEGDALANTGIMPMPDLQREQVIGGHCMLTVGYGQKPGYFTVRNSWNTDWGDQGDLYMPEAYLGSTDFGADYWIVKHDGVASA